VDIEFLLFVMLPAASSLALAVIHSGERQFTWQAYAFGAFGFGNPSSKLIGLGPVGY
jgi:hypothetical protein